METIKETNTIINKPGRVVRNALIITALLIAGAIITGYSNMDGMKGGFALIILFGFLALCSFITAMVYIPRAREFNKLVNNLHPLARWSYTPQEWDDFVKEDLKETIAINKSMLRLVIIISVVVCCLLLFIYHDKLFIVIIAGLILLLTLVAFIAPYVRKGILKKGVHEVLISENAVYVGGTFQTWKHLGARLTGAAVSTDLAVPILCISIEFPTRTGYQETIIRTPVPAGKIKEAKNVVEILQKQVRA